MLGVAKSVKQTIKTHAVNSIAPTQGYRQSALIALVTLFFLQLLTTWIESMYRIGVIKTSMGNEMYGMLVMFVPLLLLVVPVRLEGIALRLAVVAILVARAAIPLLGVRGNVVVAGVGVAASVVVIAFVFSNVYSELRRELGAGISLGLLASIALRAWGSSYDLTLGGSGVVVGWLLIAAAVVLLLQTSLPKGKEISAGRGSILASLILSIALFANIAITYWVLSSPAVVTAWTESSYLVNVVLLVCAWSTALWQSKWLAKLTPTSILLWNIAFVASLVGGIWLHTPDVPMTVETSPVIVPTPPFVWQIPIHLICLLSPVVLANILQIAGQKFSHRPTAMAIPMVLGLMVLVLLTLMAIFTNVWGYVGQFSQPFRGKFYIPFLLAGGLMLLPFLIVDRNRSEDGSVGGPTTRTIMAAIAIGLLAISGVLYKSSRNGPPELAENRITVLTYNLQLGSEPEGDQNFHDQIALLRDIDADIVGLQESDAARPGGGNIDVARLFGDSLGYYTYYGPNSIAGSFGTAVLSRFPLTNTRTIFSYSDKDEAGTAVADVQINGRTITIFNSHPAGKDKAKLAHIDDLVAAVQPIESVIAVGDYNMRQGSMMYYRISAALINSWNSIYPNSIGAQHPTIGVQEGTVSDPIDMTERIDHIFHTANFEAAESYYLPTPQSETDHPAHWSILTWE